MVAHRYKHRGPGRPARGLHVVQRDGICWARARPLCRHEVLADRRPSRRHPAPAPGPVQVSRLRGGRRAPCSASQGRSQLRHSPRGQLPRAPTCTQMPCRLGPPPPSQDLEPPSQLHARLSRHLRLYDLSGRPPSMRFAPPMAEASDTTASTLPRVPREAAFPRLLLLVPPKHGAPGSSGRSGCGRFETTGRLGR